MEIRTLNYFLVTAQQENITHAANALHMTQPTLSRQIMQLEDELGVKLFVRGKRRLTLTEEGLLLRQRAEEVMLLVRKTEREFTEKQEVCFGTVSIGCTETMAASVLPELLKIFHQEYPQINYELFCGSTDDVKERLENGIVDIGIIRGPVNAEKFDFIQIPVKDQWGILFPIGDALAETEAVSLQQVSAMPLLIPGSSVFHEEIESWFKKENIAIRILATYNTLSTAVILTQKGIGYTICPEAAVNLADERLVTFRPFVPQCDTRGTVIWKKQQIFTTAALEFMQFINHTYEA